MGAWRTHGLVMAMCQTGWKGGILHPKPILLDGIEGKRERKGENKEKKRRERKEKIERNERKWKEGSCAGSISEKRGAGLRPNR